jgi:hypothetical protein
MRLADLNSVQFWLPQHPTAHDSLWQRQVGDVSETDIQLFYARAGLKRQRRAAIDAIDQLQTALILAAIHGELGEAGAPAALILHELPPEPFLVDELVDGLARMPLARRQACMFALEAHLTPQETADLTWRDAAQLQRLSPLARELLQAASQVRHLKLPYVWWQRATPTIATPLLELTWSAREAFDCSWPELAQRYARMVRVNPSADAASLLRLARR